MKPTLNDLGLRYGTDKSTADHGYCAVYDELFTHLRHEPIQLLELGIHKGASLRMWADYFDHPQRWIYGIDRAPADPCGERVLTTVGDQAHVPEGDWDLDVIIDDASHISSKTIASFTVWWKLLKPGGYYVAEDLVTSYDPSNYTHLEASVDPDQSTMLGHKTAMQFFRGLADEVVGCPARFQHGYGIEWLRFHPNMVIMKKHL